MAFQVPSSLFMLRTLCTPVQQPFSIFLQPGPWVCSERPFLLSRSTKQYNRHFTPHPLTVPLDWRWLFLSRQNSLPFQVLIISLFLLLARASLLLILGSCTTLQTLLSPLYIHPLQIFLIWVHHLLPVGTLTYTMFLCPQYFQWTCS